MRVLVITFYYHPDLSAGSFRTTAFVRSLKKKLPPGSTIEVLTTQPNRYHSYSKESEAAETRDGIVIRRIGLPRHESGMMDQANAFRVFARQVLSMTRGAHFDLVYATSSRMFTAFLGALCARRLQAPLYLDIRDVLNVNLRELLNRHAVRLLLPGLNAVERYTIRSASRINLVSRGFLPYFESRYPKSSFSVFPNGIDDEFLEVDFRKPDLTSDTRRIVCAGNIGQGQGLHRILPGLAAAADKSGFRFDIIGAGGASQELAEALERTGVSNVTVSPPVPRKELLEHYRNADILFLHLNDFDAFRTVLPSKLFEYAATGKPILAGVAGYAAQFIRDEVPNAAVFPPCDVEAAAEGLRGLRLEQTNRERFIARFRRDGIMEGLAADCLALCGGPALNRVEHTA